MGKLMYRKIKANDTEGIWFTYIDDRLYILNNKNKYSKEIFKELNKCLNIKFREENEEEKSNNRIHYFVITITYNK